jgi:hypothetical protein
MVAPAGEIVVSLSSAHPVVIGPSR